MMDGSMMQGTVCDASLCLRLGGTGVGASDEESLNSYPQPPATRYLARRKHAVTALTKCGQRDTSSGKVTPSLWPPACVGR